MAVFNDPPVKLGREKSRDDMFVNARQEYDNRIGSAIVHAYNWRLACFATIILCMILAFGLIYQSSKATVRPYVIEVGTNGIARAVGMADQQKYTPKAIEVKHFLAEWVLKMRSASTDTVVTQKNWAEAYGVLSEKATLQVKEMIKASDPTTILGNGSRQVKIIVVIAVSEKTYQVRWEEKEYDIAGGLKNDQVYTGNFIVEFRELTDETSLLQNPLGIEITDIRVAKDIK
ncbi:MAG: conjugal transfer protein TrbF [Patescibacteria group bacterium]|jgi:type IV secretion system protein VirB5